MPKVAESHPICVASIDFRGDSTSTNMYAKNIMSASSTNAVQRAAAESLSNRLALFTVFTTITVLPDL